MEPHARPGHAPGHIWDNKAEGGEWRAHRHPGPAGSAGRGGAARGFGRPPAAHPAGPAGPGRRSHGHRGPAGRGPVAGRPGPPMPRNALQALVSRLRQAAGRDLVEYLAGGYRLAVDPGQIDADVRAPGAAGPRGPGRRRAGPRRGAAAPKRPRLWRGPALADVADAPFAAGPDRPAGGAAAGRDRGLDRGGAGPGPGRRAVPGGRGARGGAPAAGAAARPAHAGPVPAGRQGDALAVYEDTRRLLAERLGVDPSPALAAVHLAILRGRPGPRRSRRRWPPRLARPAARGPGPRPVPACHRPISPRRRHRCRRPIARAGPISTSGPIAPAAPAAGLVRWPRGQPTCPPS